MASRLGIDIGGTFAHLQAFDGRTKRSGSVKPPAMPEAPSIGPTAGTDKAAGRFGFARADVRRLLHGTMETAADWSRLHRGDRSRLEIPAGCGFGPPGQRPAAEAASDRPGGCAA